MAIGWTQTAIACVIAGTIVPGLSQGARVPCVAGMLLIAAMATEAAWNRLLIGRARQVFFGLVLGLLAIWLVILLYGSYIWLLIFPYYRAVGIATILLSLPALVLGWQAVESGTCAAGWSLWFSSQSA